MATRVELSPTSQSLMNMQWLKHPLENDPVEIKVTYEPEGSFKLEPAESDNKSLKLTLTRNPTSAGPYDSIYHAFTGSMTTAFTLPSMEMTLDSEVTVRQRPFMTEFFINTVGESSGDPMILSIVRPS